MSYLETPPQIAILYADVIPERNRDTLWSNMYLAYEARPNRCSDFSANCAVHSFAKNFTPDRFQELDMEGRVGMRTPITRRCRTRSFAPIL